jgi:hypothetical protein
MDRDERAGEERTENAQPSGLPAEEDRLFRSHFRHVNRLEGRSFDEVRPAYELGYGAAADPRFAGRAFDEVEKDLEGGWLNVRTHGGEWQAVRDCAQEGFERGRRLGFVDNEFLADTPSHHRASFSDPVAGGIDPTSPDSPEQTLDFRHEEPSAGQQSTEDQARAR